MKEWMKKQGLFRLRLYLIIMVGILVLFAMLMFIPVDLGPHDNTRMIVDQTYRIYIAPPCYEQTEVTNNLLETTFGSVVESSLQPESACTAEALSTINVTMWSALKERLFPTRWNW
ncbi:hypothetical protein GCM10008968_33810 [Bacillus horti]